MSKEPGDLVKLPPPAAPSPYRVLRVEQVQLLLRFISRTPAPFEETAPLVQMLQSLPPATINTEPPP